MDKFVYVFTTNWELNDGPCHEITGIFDSFEKAYNRYRDIRQEDLSESVKFDYDESLQKSEDYLSHYIEESNGYRYIEYNIEKLKVE